MAKLRILLLISLSLLPDLIRAAAPAPTPAWTFQRYAEVMKQSGRKPGIGAKTFASIQTRRTKAIAIVNAYLKERLGKTDPAVLRAFSEVPREYFHYHYEDEQSIAAVSYEDDPQKVKPWAIGYGSVLSDYLGQMYMTQIAQPAPGEVALEVGTGSGYQAALLSRIVKRVYSIEIIQPLGTAVGKIYKPLGYDNVETRVGDGFYGWPEVKGGFDIIIVTCAAQYIPPALVQQLKPNGRLIIPVGQPFRKRQFLYVVTKDEQGRVRTRKDVGAFFIPMMGAIQKTRKPS